MSARPVAEESGFTLIELLVTIFAGIVIVMATFTILDLSIHQQVSASDRVEATQRGRSAMEALMQELNSGCVWASTPTVQANSDNTTVWFLSQFSSAAVPTPILHEVTVTGGSVVSGTVVGASLSDTSYALTNTNTLPQNWTTSAFNTTPSGTKILATNVSYPSATGVFQYYQYVNGSINADSAHLVAAPVTSATNANVAEVTVAFAVGPSDGSTVSNRIVNLSDAAVFAPPPESTAQCQ